MGNMCLQDSLVHRHASLILRQQEVCAQSEGVWDRLQQQLTETGGSLRIHAVFK